MYGSIKYPYCPHRRSLEIPSKGVLKAKLLEENTRLNLGFLGRGGGRGAKQKTFHGGSMDIFWNYTMYLDVLFLVSRELQIGVRLRV